MSCAQVRHKAVRYTLDNNCPCSKSTQSVSSASYKRGALSLLGSTVRASQSSEGSRRLLGTDWEDPGMLALEGSERQEMAKFKVRYTGHKQCIHAAPCLKLTVVTLQGHSHMQCGGQLAGIHVSALQLMPLCCEWFWPLQVRSTTWSTTPQIITTL